jgi:hypothetical protein
MKGQTHGGKGSTTRPTNYKNFSDAYDAIFGRKEVKSQDGKQTQAKDKEAKQK